VVDLSRFSALEWPSGKGIQAFGRIGLESFKVNFFFLEVLGFELRAYTLIHSISLIFVMDSFEIGSHELFAQAGFEP
jgi:hypothetical protein